jgi:hypothetical protein
MVSDPGFSHPEVLLALRVVFFVCFHHFGLSGDRADVFGFYLYR